MDTPTGFQFMNVFSCTHQYSISSSIVFKWDLSSSTSVASGRLNLYGIHLVQTDPIGVATIAKQYEHLCFSSSAQSSLLEATDSI